MKTGSWKRALTIVGETRDLVLNVANGRAAKVGVGLGMVTEWISMREGKSGRSKVADTQSTMMQCRVKQMMGEVVLRNEITVSAHQRPYLDDLYASTRAGTTTDNAVHLSLHSNVIHPLVKTCTNLTTKTNFALQHPFFCLNL